jgi:hypothetical protein
VGGEQSAPQRPGGAAHCAPPTAVTRCQRCSPARRASRFDLVPHRLPEDLTQNPVHSTATPSRRSGRVSGISASHDLIPQPRPAEWGTTPFMGLHCANAALVTL